MPNGESNSSLSGDKSKLEFGGKRRRSRTIKFIGIAMAVLGTIFVIFSLAPALVPGGVPTGPLEFGGKGLNDINALELLFGAIIVVIGFSLSKFGYRHKVIFTIAGVIAVFFLSGFATFSSLNSYLYFTGINVTIQYGVNDQGYFGPTEQTFSITNQTNQNMTVDEGSSFTVSFSLRESSQASEDDNLASIKATIPAAGGFSGSQVTLLEITSERPPLPISFSPGSLILIKLSLEAPYYGTGQNCLPQYCQHGEYYGPIDLVIITTNG
jgi:hypothetical protein